MVHRVHAVLARLVAVQHHLDVLGAVGKLHVHPAQVLASHGAPTPGLRAAEDVLVEADRGLVLAHHDPDVAHERRDAGGRQVLALVLEGLPPGQVLHDFQGVPVRIMDEEVLVADLPHRRHGRHLHPPGSKV